MTLDFKLKGADNSNGFLLKFNNQTFRINQPNGSCIFSFDSCGEYVLSIIQEPDKPLKHWQKALFCLLSLIQFIFVNYIYPNDENWYDDINPFYITKTMKLKLNGSSSLICCYLKGRINKKSVLYSFDNDILINDITEYIKNDSSFKIKFFHYFRLVTTAFLCIFLILIIAILQTSIRKKFEFTLLFIGFLFMFFYLYFSHLKKTIKQIKELKSEIYTN